MTLRPHSIAYEIMYDENTKKATGVKVIDSETNLTYEYFSRLILEGRFLQGGEDVYTYSPGARYFIFFFHVFSFFFHVFYSFFILFFMFFYSFFKATFFVIY